MARQAFDKDGNKIPFAIIEGDYVIDNASVPTKPRLIQLSVTNVNKRGVFLTASDYLTYEVVEVALTFDEAYTHDDWIIVSNYWPIDKDIPSTSFVNPREYTDRLLTLQNEVRALREEMHSTTTRERYELLSSHDGPIRATERMIDTLKMLVSVSMHATFGFWPSNFRDRLGI